MPAMEQLVATLPSLSKTQMRRNRQKERLAVPEKNDGGKCLLLVEGQLASDDLEDQLAKQLLLVPSSSMPPSLPKASQSSGAVPASALVVSSPTEPKQQRQGKHQKQKNTNKAKR